MLRSGKNTVRDCDSKNGIADMLDDVSYELVLASLYDTSSLPKMALNGVSYLVYICSLSSYTHL